MKNLDQLRTQLFLPSISDEQRKELRQQICDLIERGNWIMGLDLVARNEDGSQAEEDTTPVDNLFKMVCPVLICW